MAVRGLSSMNKSLFVKLSTEIISRGASLRSLCLKPVRSSDASNKENNVLVISLEGIGVDVKMVRARLPSILKKQITNEGDLKEFLRAKGADRETVASIISRYPRAITRSYQSVNKRWEIWRSILQTDLEVLTILKRSPEAFFRSENNENMQKNIAFFNSLGLTSSDLCKMLTRNPRIFSNSVMLNKQMVDTLCEIYSSLGGKNPDDFIKRLISKNGFIFLRSSKQVKANVHLLLSSFNLDSYELLTLLCGQGSDVLDLSNEYLKKNLANVRQKLLSHGCTENDVDMFVLKHLRSLYLPAQKLNDKIDFLLQANIDIKQIVKCPRVLDKNINTIRYRIEQLEKLDYDFTIHGIGIFELSESRFAHKLKKLGCTKFSKEEMSCGS